jgi:hypothetical protein
MPIRRHGPPARLVTPAFLMLSLLALSGCIAAAAGAAAGYGAVEFQNGTYTTSMPATLDPTWRATLTALEQMGASIQGKTRDATSATIRARLPDQTDTEITLGRGLSSDFTRVSIRVGLFGDEPRARAIAAGIRGSLS